MPRKPWISAFLRFREGAPLAGVPLTGRRTAAGTVVRVVDTVLMSASPPSRRAAG